jgi:hypothetical protein
MSISAKINVVIPIDHWFLLGFPAKYNREKSFGCKWNRTDDVILLDSALDHYTMVVTDLEIKYYAHPLKTLLSFKRFLNLFVFLHHLRIPIQASFSHFPK